MRITSFAPTTKSPSGGDEELLQVVIETPRGSRHKYTYDEAAGALRLKSTLPAGMVFPYDFGFLPGTVGGDDDPLDVLVLGEEPGLPGCIVLARLLGVRAAEQTVDGEIFRNDVLIAVGETARMFAAFRTSDDLPPALLSELQAFFENYHLLGGKPSRTLGWQDATHARELINEGIVRARK